MITEAAATARAAGCTGTLIVRMDSAFYGARACAAARKAGACFSVTVWTDPKVRAAIAAIGQDAWTAIRYPAPSGMTSCTAGFLTPRSPRPDTPRSPRAKGQAITARLIVRRVRDLNRDAAVAGQGELFPAWRYHTVFTDSLFTLLISSLS